MTQNREILLLVAVFVVQAMLMYSHVSAAGPYAGVTVSIDNDRGFCSKVNYDDYCQTARAFVGYDGQLEDGWGYDASVSYEEQLDGGELLNPTRGSVTVYKRW